MSDDKVTLEWLMRFEGLLEDKMAGRDKFSAYVKSDHVKRMQGELGINAEMMYTIDIMRVVLYGKMGMICLYNPTIARFHEAVAFLGAKLPPLRPGEA